MKPKDNFKDLVIQWAIVAFWVIVGIFALAGCSSKWHLKRAIKLDPGILVSGDTLIIDTLLFTDSIYIKDSFVLTEYDTISVFTDSISYQIIRQKDSFYIQIKTPPDTIRITKEIKLPGQIKYVKRPIPWLQIVIALAAFILIVKFFKWL